MPPLPCVSARLETILGLGRIAHTMQLITVPSLSTSTWVARSKRGSLFPTHLYPQAPRALPYSRP